jgi:O-acetylhomoserine/O-acetylserine sulfhydrylase-like pyridoxal-dependent enzyme
MILDHPGDGVEILGEDWNYTNDRWGETYACIDYTRAREPHFFLEQCFAFTQPNLTLDSEREKLLTDNYEVLKPNNTFGNVGQISVMAIRLEDHSGKGVKIFELLGIENYLLRVEMKIATDDTSLLQRIYEEQAADIIDYVLQNMLEKSRLVPRPIATPLSPTQESFYVTVGNS